MAEVTAIAKEKHPADYLQKSCLAESNFGAMSPRCRIAHVAAIPADFMLKRILRKTNLAGHGRSALTATLRVRYNNSVKVIHRRVEVVVNQTCRVNRHGRAI